MWIYTPATHKNAWRGHKRHVPLGARSQSILQPFLDRAPDAYLFSPIEADAWRQREKFGKSKPDRTTPIYPSELRTRARRRAARASRVRQKVLHERYNTASYNRAIHYAIVVRAQKADATVQHWHANQLRHSRGTELRRLFGIESARVALGHKHLSVTEVYSERDLQLAERIAAETG